MKGLDALERYHKLNVLVESNKILILKDVEEYNAIKKELQALEIIRKHFIIKLQEETELNGNVWGRLVSIQGLEDEGAWDCTASANLANYKEEFELLMEVIK